ncbi:MAG: DUF1295 domain-containing protein [Planctomycetes bacterium]|nr:DUF1295 domain-containing protein [Planctomycetota bacterium]
MNAWAAAGIAWGVLALSMALLWVLQQRTRNAGIVDVAWSFGTAGVGALFALIAEGDVARRVAIGSIALAWGARLGAHLARRVARESEDGRYLELREKWGRRASAYLFLFFQLQAIWAVLFALPMFAAAANETPSWRVVDIVGVLIAVVAIGGEALSDHQLARFRREPGNLDRVCREGLWRYSRHPNYFFEWVHWFAYVALAWGGSAFWMAVLGPLVMLFFLFRITGIPPTERRAIARRGDAYREYQRTTSVFVPLPPKG